MTIKEILSENTDEIIGISVVIPMIVVLDIKQLWVLI